MLITGFRSVVSVVSFFAEVDPTTKSFPTSVRQQLADEMGDPSTEVGAVLSATYVPLLPDAATAAARGAVHTALGGILTTPLDHIGFGDSITVGSGTTGPGKRWIDRFRDRMRFRNPPGVVGGFGYVPVGDVYAPVLPNVGWVLGGGAVATVSSHGQPNSTFVEFAAAGQTATLAFTGTGIRLHYLKYDTSNSQLQVTIDGTVVATPPFGAPTDNAGHADYTGLAVGSHTIVVTHLAGSTPYRIDGALIFQSDAAAGWRCIPHARSGATVNTDSRIGDWVTAYMPGLVTVYYGVNEYRNNITTAAFGTNLGTLIDLVQTKSPRSVVVLVAGYEPAHPGTPIAPWSDYRQVVFDAAATRRLAVLDLQTTFGEGVISSVYSSDNVHPNDEGHSMIADALAMLLGV